jgi:hypothetical protein
VLAELRTTDESGHYGHLRRALLSQLFPTTHPYARGIGGTPPRGSPDSRWPRPRPGPRSTTDRRR